MLKECEDNHLQKSRMKKNDDEYDKLVARFVDFKTMVNMTSG